MPGPLPSDQLPLLLSLAVILETVKETPSQTQVPEVIHVTLKVPSIFPPYKHSISVLDGSSLEDVLKKAQEHGRFR